MNILFLILIVIAGGSGCVARSRQYQTGYVRGLAESTAQHESFESEVRGLIQITRNQKDEIARLKHCIADPNSWDCPDDDAKETEPWE